MTYYKQIDSFRFFAAFAVLTSHWLHTNAFVKNLHLGGMGVDFFFIISGFLITYQLLMLKESVDADRFGRLKALGNFILRRGLRIFPLYYLVLILATVLNKNEIRDAFFYNVSYTSNFYFIAVQKWNSIFSHFWSLSVEEHFYIVWPIILLFINRNKIYAFSIAVILFSIAFRYVIFTNTFDYFSVHIHTLACLDLFMYGGILACFLRFKPDSFTRIFSIRSLRFFVVAGILLNIAIMYLNPDNLVYTWVFFRASFGFLCAFLVGHLVIGFKGLAAKVFENKWLTLGGKLSYAIYLVHSFVPGMLLGLKRLELGTYTMFLMYFIVTVVISYALHYLVEQPVRRWGDRFKLKVEKIG